MRNLVVLCVFAHPDDECFMCGGTIAHLSSVGSRVILVTFTKGENATQGGRKHLSKSVLKAVRRRELDRSSKILGIERVHLLNYPDGGLENVPEKGLRAAVRQYLQRYNPSFVFTFTPDGITRHSDHQTISRVTATAFQSWMRSHRRHRAELWMFGYPNSVRRRVGLPLVHNPRLIRKNVSRFVEIKLQAIFAHRSQVRSLERFAHLSQRVLRRIMGSEYVLVKEFRHTK